MKPLGPTPLRRQRGELSAITGSSCDQQGRDKLVYWITRHHRNRVDAEDVLHDAFVRLEQSRRRTAVVDPVGFLLHTAANLAIDHYRKRRRLSPEPFELACAGVADPAPPIDEVLFVRARLARARQGLNTLGSRTRAVFLMHRLEGRKQREIAASLGISQSAVEKHIAKAAVCLSQWMRGW